ncbi:hypothetical protein [Leifsonia poae]|uniref:DUF1345 domain-containing protein n=1 Tax=Leifsonia poae TaxID=110933 RepID=A0A9W6HB79_9MICO|nr:hypothetical protein [Leifsonia poae]GLJ76931.1 hypothetical protein GCM10017584_25050 [Leifsonia poae]
MSDKDDKRARNVAPEHRWPAVFATLVALAAYAILPSVVPLIERYVVVGICLVLLIVLIAYNPHHLTKESRWSRRLEIALAILILVANQVAFVETIIRLLAKHGNGYELLFASLQVWVTNVIAFALMYWVLDRGGPVSRVSVARHELPLADFRFPQDEDHDAIDEVARGSSQKMDWVPNYVDYFYFSLSNSMAFSPTDTMPLTHRAKLLMSLESFGGFVLLALVIARAVSLIG